MIKNEFTNMGRVALYLRLSDEDRDKLTDHEVSESIKNQEIMLRNYVKSQGWRIVGVYNDEDYSGADRDRPNFNKMIDECKNGNVDIVLVKTQARFARDIELIDKYVHNKFKEWNVRFLTYIEKIDNTKRETKKTSQITGMVDEWYVEDTSINIRETFRTKRLNGEFTGSFAPYGYMKDPENKNHLIPDPVVSNVVARIFYEYVKGYGLAKICKGLTEDNILSPLEYKLMNGSKIKLPIINDYQDHGFINRSGTYIIRVSYLNNERLILKELTTIELLTDGENFSNVFELKLVKVKNDKIKIYYSTKKLEKLNINLEDDKLCYEKIDFENKNNWIPIDVNDKIPNNVSCIATNINKLDRTNEVYYEFEVYLKENRKHNNYYYKIFAKANNIDGNLNYKIQIRNKHKWNENTIKKFLKDEVYIGNLVQFRTTTVSYKNHTIIYNNEKERIRVNNTHEALVDKEIWDETQKRLKQRKKAQNNGKVHLLANKVFCESCGNVFCKCGKNDNDGMAYLCCKDKKTKWSNCNNKKYIKEKELQDYVLDKFNDILERFYNIEKQIEINSELIDNELFKDKLNSLEKEKLFITKELKRKELYLQNLYEDRKKELIDDWDYVVLRKKYKEDYRKLENRLESLQKELYDVVLKQNTLKNKNDLFYKYKHFDKLNFEIVNNFIIKIIIGCYNEKYNQRKIHIIWDFT